MSDNDFTEHEREVIKLAREAGEKIARYEAGRDDSERVEGQARTPGQLWAQLLDSSMPERQFMLEAMIRNTEGLRACFVEGHRGRIEDLTSRIEEAQRHLSETLGFAETQPLYSLLIAVRALKNVMVEGLATRESVITTAAEVELPEFAGDRGVREKIDEQLKSAGIDTQSICRFTWEGPSTDACDGGVHECRLVNPLHIEDHACDPRHCGQTLSHIEAEKLTEAGR
jgi:hypothetical protein